MEANDYITITPMSQRLELKPGEVYTGQITIANPATATGPANYAVEVAPYGVSGENYMADLVTQTGRTLLAEWTTVDEPAGVVEPNSIKRVNFTITVPENAPGGGQYAAILVSQNNDSEARHNGVAVNDIMEVASLLYADVEGEIIHQGEILENNIPGFVTGAPITLGALISNNGNVHEDAVFAITAKNVFTDEMIVEAEGVRGYYTELVMPETTRYIQRDINEELPILGIVHVEQTIYYNNTISEMARDVVICPVWFMVVVGVAIAMLITAIVQLIRSHKKKKRKKQARLAKQAGMEM